MTEDASATACVIIIGNEVLSGRTADANLSFLGRELGRLGIRVTEARIIRDDEQAIVAAVEACRPAFDYVFTTGGIGPTHDDITSASIAKAFGVPLTRNAEAMARLARQYAPEEFNAARRKMADIPEGAILLDNPVSKAPGFQIGNVFVLPGVPVIMRAMFEGFRHRLVGGAPWLSRTVVAFTTEGGIAAGLADVQARHPQVEIGSYPFVRSGRLGTSLVLRATDPVALDSATAAVTALVAGLGIEAIEEEGVAPGAVPSHI
ncbi:MAG: competence/damage-inducible protein A [Rhodospirillales bacterium]